MRQRRQALRAALHASTVSRPAIQRHPQPGIHRRESQRPASLARLRRGAGDPQQHGDRIEITRRVQRGQQHLGPGVSQAAVLLRPHRAERSRRKHREQQAHKQQRPGKLVIAVIAVKPRRRQQDGASKGSK